MVDADSYLKLLPTSILHMQKVYKYFDIMSIGIQKQPYTVLPLVRGSDFGVLGQ
jgi:hypothetical protein